MDQFLSEYYGTANEEYAQEDELEKMAQLTLLTKEAAAEGIDLNQFTDEEVLSMAEELYGNGGGHEGDLEKEAAAKFEEADFLGRVMAHSFNQELGEIEKEAGALERGAKFVEGLPARFAQLGKGAPTRAGQSVREGAEWLGGKLYSKKGLRGAAEERAKRTAMKAPTTIKRYSPKELAKLERLPGGQMRGHRELAEAELKRRRGYIAGGAGAATLAAGAGGGAYALSRRKEKKSADESAYEQLVAQRMYDHLDAAGYDADAYFGLEQEKTASDEFESILDRDALSRLQEAGVPVEWYE